MKHEILIGFLISLDKEKKELQIKEKILVLYANKLISKLNFTLAQRNIIFAEELTRIHENDLAKNCKISFEDLQSMSKEGN